MISLLILAAWQVESQETRALESALGWLARHQSKDGSWAASEHVKLCAETKCSPCTGSENFNVGLTGLSTLAFLGAGYTHRSPHEYGKTVRRALQFLMKEQQPDGRIGSDEKYKPMYNHLLGTLALIDACAKTRSLVVGDNARRAFDYTLCAQNPGRGWRYTYRSGDNDSSVTGWAAQVLRLARNADFDVPIEAGEGAVSWFDEATDAPNQNDIWVGYADRRRGKVIIPGV